MSMVRKKYYDSIRSCAQKKFATITYYSNGDLYFNFLKTRVVLGAK